MFVLRLKIIGRLVISVALLMMVSSCSTEPKSRSQVTPIPQNSSNTQQQKRIALVIGNANYQVGKLDTPLNDATDMEAALKELRFEVILLKDSSKRQMDDALDQFSTRINQGYVGLFYYAGHGVQVEGENYLIPVNAQIKAEKDVEYESIPLGKILGRMESAGNRINLVILDACRDNPFRKFSRSSSRGLTTPVQTASGTLIAFATAPGKVASDGIGRNGLFTSYLLKYIKTPNLDVDLMLRQVRSNVAKDTKNYQVPWNSSSLTGEFAFNQKAETTTPKPSPTATFSTSQPQPSPSPQLTAKAFYDSGNSKRESGDNQGAIADYNQAIKLNPNFAEAYYSRGNSKFNLKDYQGAMQDANKAIELDPNSSEAYLNRGRVYIGLNDYQKAMEANNQAIKLNPKNANAYSNRGLSKYNLGDNQGAISDYNQAIKLNPDLVQAYNNRGTSRNELKDYQGAISDYNQAIKLNPDLVQAYNNRGIAKNDLKDYQGAIADYEQAIKLKPDYVDAYNNRGAIKNNNLKDYQGAITDYNQAIKLKSDYVDAYNNRGLAKSNLKDDKGAIADYNQAIKLNPDDAKAYYNRGISKKKLGDNQGAINDFRQAAKLYQQQNKIQDYQDAINRLKELGISN
jgi:tetratricopeptide (TPR) repeat protein